MTIGRVTVSVGEEVIRSGLYLQILPDGVKLIKVIFRELENEHWMILEGPGLPVWMQGTHPYHYPSYQCFIEELADTIVGRVQREGGRSGTFFTHSTTSDSAGARPGDELLR